MENMIIFRNELKNKKPSRYKVIGIVSQIILSKSLFRRNKEIELFLKEVFNLEFKRYVLASRTMIVARLTRIIDEVNEEVYLEYKNELYSYINRNIEESNQKNRLESWKF